MLKISRIFCFVILLMMLFSITVFASEIDMNLVSNETTEENVAVDINATVDNTATNETLPLSAADDIGGTAAPSGVSSIAQENMSFSNILNILLIAVGVILILLAIAILIRLRS